jgi:hypothetical protein
MFVKPLVLLSSNVFVNFWCLNVMQVINIKMQFKGGNKQMSRRSLLVQSSAQMLRSSAHALKLKQDTIERICARA